MTFGQAIAALHEGKRVAREGWDKGMFIFKQVSSDIPPETIPKMQSLPQSVKDELARRGGGIRYKNQIAVVTHNKPTVITGWAALPSDLLESDWVVLD